MDYSKLIAAKCKLGEKEVSNLITLLEQGATIPFISRYRKELTGSMDEVQVAEVKDELSRLKELDKRREAILKSIEEQDKLSPELKAKIEACLIITDLEDIYLPFKPKKKTRASIAREKGLEPLAILIMKQKEIDILGKAAGFINDQVPDVEEALQGARDIIAEWVNENSRARNIVRHHFDKSALISSRLVKGKETEGVKFSDYFEFSEHLKKCPSHRILAMRRGEQEGFLKLSIEPQEEAVLEALNELFLTGYFDVSQQVEMAVKDSYHRLLAPSIENEFKAIYKEKADEEAIRVFAENLRQLLLSSPLGQKPLF